jgi:hypothetical protein
MLKEEEVRVEALLGVRGEGKGRGVFGTWMWREILKGC